MTRKTIVFIFLVACGLLSAAQQLPEKTLRITDSLTAKEKAERNPVLLRSELDSLIKRYAPLPVDAGNQEKPVQRTEVASAYLLAGMALLILVSGWILFLLFRQRRNLGKTLKVLQQQAGMKETVSANGNGKTRGRSTTGSNPEARMEILNAELLELAKENEGLQGVIKTYNGIQQDFDSLKQVMQKMYKVKNYPGYDKNKDELIAFKNVLATEGAVAEYAYEKFLKPVLAIADTHKNYPSKMNTADREKIFDLLLSLSFFYIEYLYLRVNELSVGGTIVERIRNLTGGQALKTELLKQLNTDSGSRALVVRLALSKMAVKDLSYPVFDETNLNH